MSQYLVLSISSYTLVHLRDIPTSSGGLSPQVAGKRLFYTADDRRINMDSHLSCASCHLDGGRTSRVWDLTGHGESLHVPLPLGVAGVRSWSRALDRKF